MSFAGWKTSATGFHHRTRAARPLLRARRGDRPVVHRAAHRGRVWLGRREVRGQVILTCSAVWVRVPTHGRS
jgi:hypothetical protein